MRRRRYLVPETVQTSATDCGPACLKCLLEGYGISASYGRLREACQTDLDGTSIDTIEEVACELGLPAEQVMLPADHLLLPEARTLPAMVVVRQPAGLTHFVIVWRTLGRFVQLMDPATGRRWPHRATLLGQLYLHQQRVPRAAWLEWARSAENLDALAARMRATGVTGERTRALLDSAMDDARWRSLAALDASTRMVQGLVDSGGLSAGASAGRVLEGFFERARVEDATSAAVPPDFWSVVEPPDGGTSADGEAEPLLVLRGAVLVRIKESEVAADLGSPEETAERARTISPELAAALTETETRPGRELVRFLGRQGAIASAAILALMALAAAGLVFEALLFRGFFDIGNELGTANQRLAGGLALLSFLIGMLLVELPIAQGVLRLGRQLESRLRLAFLQKIPRLSDRYFHSRLSSDMAERSHSVHRLRLFPELAEGVSRAVLELLMTTAGIIWLDPGGAPLAILIALLAVGLPLAAMPILQERDLRVRNHLGGLGRFYLSGLLGLVPLRTHTAERAMRREHESLLVEWARAHLGRERTVVVLDAVLHVALLALIAVLLFRYVGDRGHGTGVLLLVFWSLNLFALGRLASLLLAHQYPTYRNVALRLLEPLGAAEEAVAEKAPPPAAGASSRGVEISIVAADVRAGGHRVLSQIDLAIEPGRHVAVVGPSGAGKSSLVGLLLGWHRPAAGSVAVDGAPLTPETLARLRRETAWVDPEVQIWNRSLLRNLTYGEDEGRAQEIGAVIDQADLVGVMEKLPDGLQTELGEGGGLVSGGEGQRVRLGRGLFRRGIRLAILDEPFRGLARNQRTELLARARRHWQDATLVCVTHDVGETRRFERVVVMDGGRIVEDGHPEELARSDGPYSRLLRAEEEVWNRIWADPSWRRLRIEGGRVIEGVPKGGGS